jgi:putative transposase
MLMKVSRSALNYRWTRAAHDAPVVARMHEIAGQYPRYGYRRIRIFLGREGYTMSSGRMERRWREARLQVPRKRVASSRSITNARFMSNQVWAFDFVFNACANGQKLKFLTIADEFTRERLATEAAGTFRQRHVIDVLSPLVSERGAPTWLWSDNCPEFVSNAILKWITDQNIETSLIDPAKP